MKVKLKYNLKVYMGDSISSKNLILIKSSIRRGKRGLFLITTSDKDDELLQIVEASQLKSPIFNNHEYVVGGIAKGKGEAEKLLVTITEDCYDKRKDLNLKEFISCGQYY